MYPLAVRAGAACGGFAKLTELAAAAVREAKLPGDLKVTVLFEAYYLCPTVVQAVHGRGCHYIGVGKSNRRFQVKGQSHRLSRYGPNVLRRSGGVSHERAVLRRLEKLLVA